MSKVASLARKGEEYLTRRDLNEVPLPIVSNAEIWLTAYKPIMSYYKKRTVQTKIDFRSMHIEIYRGNIIIVKETCDRCQTTKTPPGQRLLKPLSCDIPNMYLESKVCNDCINCARIDPYISDVYDLSQIPPKYDVVYRMFTDYCIEYEKAWRVVLAAAPDIVMTEKQWEHRVDFFGGCCFCGNPVEARGYFFPRRLNGKYNPWNVVPLCGECVSKHYRGRMKMQGVTHRYKVFSTADTFTRYKTIRLYLLSQMDELGIWTAPLEVYRSRFRETRTLKGSRVDGLYGTATEMKKILMKENLPDE